MNDWHAILAPFRWSDPLSRRDYAARSAVAALASIFCLFLAMASSIHLFVDGAISR